MLAISVAIHLLGSSAATPAKPPIAPSPEQKAVAFLSREVPRWSRENRCFSCHNNGDAARALLHAAHAGFKVPDAALTDTTQWLQHPERWDHNGGDGPFNDRRLARVAFTAALATARSTGRVNDRAPVLKAAESLALDQAADGSWPLQGEDATSAPATYGRPLATLLARQSLAAADPVRFQSAINRANAWLQKRKVRNVTDASVVLLAFSSPAAGQSPAEKELRGAIDLLARNQAPDGGWGLDGFSPPEPFDTALALLALAKCVPTAPVKAMTERGRRFLIASQQEDGSWPETTRPPGNVSYAERISTAGWCTMALLATAQAAPRTDGG
jgi:hypothetical protein